ncbi:uncharacterized protein SCHCODRAFT_02517285 [Schizophyllum commune H4-8]|nr:uncharacterized protein SCHCODRAFT_02517285 [Schizophyllum commune H4-8]KAI5886664.1 hypothetical protein SCHCODRAFT_02517285 [Schizophyllum commune H4-8]
MPPIQCPYCEDANFFGSKGLKLHLSQKKTCRDAMDQVVAAAASQAGGINTVTSSNTTYDLPPDIPPPNDALEEEPQRTTPPQGPFVTAYPPDRAAGARLRRGKTPFGEIRDTQAEHGLPPYAPFGSLDEWEHLRWLVTSGTSQRKIDEYLKMKSVHAIGLPYHNKASFFRAVDQLPQAPGWSCRSWTVKGNVVGKDGAVETENVELWLRDPIACIRELLGNPSFKDHSTYAPYRVYERLNDQGEGVNREYDEMWTANWWWEVQDKLGLNATVCPVILSTDKTQLSAFSGDKQAWPVYLTIGNISKDIRRQPSSRATVLVGYLPVCKLTCFREKERSLEGYRLFHECMSQILDGLVTAGQDGVEMTCADGWVRRIHPILAAYIADYPEQCLVCCIRENSCPCCKISPDDRGKGPPFDRPPLRKQAEAMTVLTAQAAGNNPPAFDALNLRAVKPFWHNLPHTDIFSCMTPDLLHQVHKGVFKEHVAKWSTLAIGLPREELDESARKREMDARYQATPLHHTLRHFNKGISRTTQWTGKEQKGMEKTFLGTLDEAVDVEVVRANRGLLDFIYLGHFERHTDESLSEISKACAVFHKHKDIFIELGIREHFNISKIHALLHYADAIRSRGTADGFNTEGTERLHIDLAKMGYRASNRKQYSAQMTKWLARQEAVWRFDTYLLWAMPGYDALRGDSPNDHDDDEDVDGDDDEEGGEDMRSRAMEGGDLEVEPGAATMGEDGEDEEMFDEENYAVAKTAAFPRLSLASIFRDYDVDELAFHLLGFLDNEGITPLRTDLGLDSPIRFPVYKQVSLKLQHLPEAASESIDDKVLAMPPKPRRVSKMGVVAQESPAQFSTVLVRERAAKEDGGPLDGLTPARVRLLFKLPNAIGSYPHPLAYVDFYTPLSDSAAYNTDLGMFRIKRATRQGVQHSAVIPVTNIVRSCHLIPQFKRSVDRTWTATNVLDEAPHFYLNPYLRHHDFYLLRYLYERYRRERERLERERQEHDRLASASSARARPAPTDLPPAKRRKRRR